MPTKTELITDEQSLVSATSRFGYAIQTYDDGFGPLWVIRDSMGVAGIVRAQTWEDAYSIAEDEIFPEATETIAELIAEYNIKREYKKRVRVKQTGVERFAQYPDDYPNGTLSPDLDFISYDTIETKIDPDEEQVWQDNEIFEEQFGFRPNGPNSRDKVNHGIYARDLSGERLDRLTPQMITDWEITLTITTNE